MAIDCSWEAVMKRRMAVPSDKGEHGAVVEGLWGSEWEIGRGGGVGETPWVKTPVWMAYLIGLCHEKDLC